MNKLKLLLLVTTLSYYNFFAQVGIGTTSPKATLDIKSSSTSSPTNTDGILLPSIENFPATRPGADQNGMMVFLNTATSSGSTYGANPVGFYYWSNPLNTWVGISNAGEAWKLSGNSGTVDGTNYLGTTDNVPLNFRMNNQKAGRIATNQTFFGYLAGSSNTSNYNTAFGAEALQNFTGSRNTAMGYQALKSATTSNNSVAIGYQSLNSIVDGGGQNVAIGYEALKTTTSTSNNTAVGYRSLSNTTSGSSNTAVGANAMLNTQGGQENVAVGRDALLLNTSGNENTAVGREAMRANTTGNQNVGVGKNSLASNTTGLQNTAVGKNAMILNTTGEKNTAVGSESLNDNKTGNYNTAVGFAAMFGSDAALRNAALGYEALRNTKAEGNVAIGFNTMRLSTTGNYNTAAGHEALYNILAGTENVGIGHIALNQNTNGSNNVAVGYRTLYNNKTGTNNVALGHNADLSTDGLTNAIAIGADSRVNASNKIRLGNTAITAVEAQVSLSTTSDSRYKNSIENLSLGLDFINTLRPVEYIRNNDAEQTKEWGLIAQELKKAIENANYTNAGIVTEDDSPDKFLTVRYNDLLAPIIKSIQELSEKEKEIEALKKKVKNQEQAMSELLERVKALEQQK